MIHDALKMIREQRRLKPVRVEELTGILRNSISVLELGKTVPTRPTLEKLAKAYCCRLSTFELVSEMLDDSGYDGEFTPEIGNKLFYLMRGKDEK